MSAWNTSADLLQFPERCFLQISVHSFQACPISSEHYSNSTIDKKREIMYNNSQKELKNMIPVEIRKLIIKNREEGVKVSEISRILKVSESAIYSICRKYEERKHLNGNYPGRKPKITEEQKKAVIKLVEERPDITLKEIIEELKLPIKKSRVSKILLNEKMFFKKETGTRK